VYRNILDSHEFEKCLSPDRSLVLINVLKKLCNTPGLLNPANLREAKEQSEGVKALLADIHEENISSTRPSSSGKLKLLDRLVQTLKSTTNEKIVIVSNYTQTLDILQQLLQTRSLTFLRLDGTTPTDKRQPLVDRFNKATSDEAFAFLLSAKSGGAGINLIGASRLVLFDLDWNPATDAQAMARIHRDGQKRPVMIYRLLTTGCFDEKIFQRQITKQGLADSVMDKKASTGAFTMAELKDLFSLDENTDCQTHDLLGCPCAGKGYLAEEEQRKIEEEGLLVDEEPQVVRGGLMKASQVTEEIIRGKNTSGLTKEGLGALMGYDHIATRRLKKWEALEDEEGDVTLEDQVLMTVLTQNRGDRLCGFAFQKCF
jgi:DNA repair and recombination protein RAD54B